MDLKVKKLREDAILPTRAHPTDAGLDLYSIDDTYLVPGTRTVVGTGIAVEIPESFGGFVTPRSGLAAKKGVTITNSPGLIDSGYRGEVCVILEAPYSAEKSIWINYGDRIGQLVILPCPYFNPVEVEELSITKRDEGGFGSSGK
jgi:dUTP pyrophosphatase